MTTTNYRPLIEVLRELKTLTQQKASGFFFIVTQENHSCIVRLHAGQILDVVFRMLRNDEAVMRLAMAGMVRGRFQPDPAAGTGNKGELSDASLEWLLGGFESDPSLKMQAASPSSASGGAEVGGLSAQQRDVIEHVALHYLGPIAGMLCEEAFESAGNAQQAIDQLAGHLPSASESQRFTQEVRAELGKAQFG